MADSVGELVVKLLFETNASKIFAEIIAGSTLANTKLSELQKSIEGLVVEVSQKNPAVAEFTSTFSETAKSSEGIKTAMQEIAQRQGELESSINASDAASKEFTITIDRQAEAEAEETGAIVSETEAQQKNAEWKRQVIGDEQELALETQRRALVTREASKVSTGSTEEEIGAIAELRGQLADATFQWERAADPTVRRQIALQIQEINQQLQAAKFGVPFEAGLGPVGQLQAKIAQLRVEMRFAAEAELPALRIQLEELSRELAVAQGQGVRYALQGIRPIRQEAFVAHQAMFALFFLMQSFDGEGSSAGMKKVHQTLQGTLSTAFAVTSTLALLGPTTASLALPVGLLAGALVGLVAALSDTDEAARKAAEEGLKEFSDMVRDLASSEKKKVELQITVNATDLQKQIDAILAEAPKRTVMVRMQGEEFQKEVTEPTPEQQQRINDLRRQIELIPERTKVVQAEEKAERDRSDEEKLNNELLEGHRTRLQEIEAALKVRNQELKTGVDHETHQVLTEEELRAIKSEVNEFTRQSADLTSTVFDHTKKQVEQSELEYENAVKTNEQAKLKETALRAELTSSLSVAESAKEQNEIYKKMEALTSSVVTRLTEQREAGRLTAEQYRSELVTLDGQVRLSSEHEDIRKALVKELTDEVKLATVRLSQGAISADQARAELESVLRVKNAKGEQILSEEKIIELKRGINAEVERHLKSEREISNQLHQAMVDNIAEGAEKAAESERFRHTQAMANIDAENPANNKTAQNQEIRQARIREEEYKHQTTVRDIQTKNVSELQVLRNNLLKSEEERIRASYDLQVREIQERSALELQSAEHYRESRKQEIRDSKLSRAEKQKEETTTEAQFIQTKKDIEERANLEITDKRKRQAKEISDSELKSLDDLVNDIARVGSALHNAFGKAGDSFFQKMLAILQIALQIAAAIKAANASGSGLGATGILGIGATVIGGIASIFGGAEGGEIPGGSYVINERASEKYKVLLDALGAGTITGGIRHEDSVPVKTPAGIAVLMPGERVLPPETAALGKAINEDELRTIREAAEFRSLISRGLTHSETIEHLRKLTTDERTAKQVSEITGKSVSEVQTVAKTALGLPAGERSVPDYLAPLGQLLNLGAVNDESANLIVRHIREVETRKEGSLPAEESTRPIILEIPPVAPGIRRMIGADSGDTGFGRVMPGLRDGGFLESPLAGIRTSTLTYSATELSQVLDELRGLRTEVGRIRDARPVENNITVEPQIHIHGALQGQTFLKKEMPEYREFEQKKYIDPTPNS